MQLALEIWLANKYTGVRSVTEASGFELELRSSL
jgi:hypothetical protein